jgi:DNA-binding transcriptional MerR regulator
MHNDHIEQEQAYWAGEVADTLGISDSTLRKYCLILERAGYHFLRGDNKRRAFVTRDVMTLKRLQEISQSKNVTLEDAARLVVSMAKGETETSVTLADMNRSLTLEERFLPILQPLIEQNELLRRELTEIKNQMAIDNQEINEKLDAIITETRTERQKKNRRWWRFW